MVTSNEEGDIINSKKLMVFLKNEIFQTLLPKEFGGTEFCHKDLLMLNEALAKDDLATFFTFNQVQSAVNLLMIHGTPEQKKKYLPLIANWERKPVLCIYDET